MANDGGEKMNLKTQVCSLELAKRLKELGVKQESLWYWQRRALGTWHLGLCGYERRETDISAFTVAELGEMLPNRTCTSRCPKNNLYYCRLEIEKGRWFGRQDVTEANARAKMLIYLLENKLIGLKDE